MKTNKINTTSEMHPLLPSGTWEGFYTYNMGQDASQHSMAFYLNFQNELIIGSGSDDIGGFSWQGTYDISKMTCIMTKAYTTHQVYYQGHIDENGIWGIWKLYGLKGGFHIWPKKKAGNEEEQAVQRNTKLLKT